MQVLYSLEHSNTATPEQAIRMLEKSIEKSYSLLIFNLALIVRIADYIKKESDIKSSKLLPTEEDLRFSTRLAENPFVKALRADQMIGKKLSLTMTEEDTALVKELFKKLSEEKEYRDYCSESAGGSGDKEIISFIYSSVIQKSPGYHQYVEDNFSECISELGKINFSMEELLRQLSSENNPRQLDLPDSSGEEEFAKQLLEKTIANNERYSQMIKPKLKNWDLDRIAHLDMILMKMALCELMCFEQIPVKVSINEYIDISKIYSTPRSKDFINGILDNIMHELRESNEIKKTGRGLVE